MLRIVVSTSTFGSAARERLGTAGHEVVLNPHGRTLTEAEIRDLLISADGLIAGTEPLTREVLDHATRLRAISRVGVGLDAIDLDAARERRIAVSNTPDAVTDAAAELTLAGILSLMRHVHLMHADLQAGFWRKRMGTLLHGKVVGIIGYGRVGRRVARLLEPFGVELLACDPVLSAACDDAAPAISVDLDELLARADIITVHASGDAGVLLGAAELAKCKRGAQVVNAARGGLVDEQALSLALQEERLAGAYLDTFASEPYAGELRNRPDVLLTPHAGSYAREAREQMERDAVDNLLRALG